MNGSRSPTLAQVRRRDRSVSDADWIRRFLQEAPVGVLAVGGGGESHLNSNLYVFDANRTCIWLHTSRAGALPRAVDEPRSACFHVFEMGRILPHERAVDFSVEYAGVTAFGTIHLVEDPERAKDALQRLLDKYAPHLRPDRDYQAATEADLKRTAVYRLDVERWSGKRKRVADDTPGAYGYGDLRTVSALDEPPRRHEEPAE